MSGKDLPSAKDIAKGNVAINLHFPYLHRAGNPSAPTNVKALDQISASTFARYFAAGSLCCTVSHGALTPMDVVKTRIQVDSSLKGMGMLSAGRKIVQSEGIKGLATGFGATAVGYFVQGGLKFSLYEVGKAIGIDSVGSYDKAVQYRVPIYLGAAAAAEFVADVALSPLEATRIRCVSNPRFADGLVSGFFKILREEGPRRGFYSGFAPLLCKQIPYSLGQFTVHEAVNEQIYGRMSAERRQSLSNTQNTGIELTSGIISGMVAAIASHPADSLLSAINKGQGGPGTAMSKLVRLAKEAGPTGIWSGLVPRMIMTAFLVSTQFVLYAQVKRALGVTTSIEIHKAQE